MTDTGESGTPGAPALSAVEEGGRQDPGPVSPSILGVLELCAWGTTIRILGATQSLVVEVNLFIFILGSPAHT